MGRSGRRLLASGRQGWKGAGAETFMISGDQAVPYDQQMNLGIAKASTV